MKIPITVIIGLGNPGQSYYYQRHSIGFRVLDALAQRYHASWSKKGKIELAQVEIEGKNILLVKPQTYMNSSGDSISLLPQGIKPEHILVVHDELELPCGKRAVRLGGSARGHNGLKSIIARIGSDFYRLRFGIGRPEDREDVPDYVLKPFDKKSDEINILIEQAVDEIVSSIA